MDEYYNLNKGFKRDIFLQWKYNRTTFVLTLLATLITILSVIQTITSIISVV